MSVLSALMVKIGADSSGLRKELKGTKNEIKNAFSVDPIIGFQNALTGTTANVGLLINKFNAAAALIGGGFGLTSLISSAVTAGASIKDLSDKLNISTEEAALFSKTVKLAGGDVDTAATAMARLDQGISGNSEAAQKARAVLDAVGVSLTDQSGKLLPLNEQLKNLAQGYEAATKAGYGQEFIMNTLGVRGMALTETLMKYNDAAEDAAKINGIGLDVNQMADLDRQLQLVNAQLNQLTMAGGALLAPIVGEYLPGITEGLAETAKLIAENKDRIISTGTAITELVVTYKALQALQKASTWTNSFKTAAESVRELEREEEASIKRRLAMLTAKQKREEAEMRKSVEALKISEAEKEKIISESCVKIQMKYSETAAKIRADMTAAFRQTATEAKAAAVIQVQAAAQAGAAAETAGKKTVMASGAAKGAVGNLGKAVWNLVGGWYAVATAISFAFQKLVEFKQEKAQEQGLTGGDIYSIDGQQYRRANDGKFYRRDINMDAEDAFDTYTETQVLEDDEIAILQAAYERKHPAYSPDKKTDFDADKIKNAFGNIGGDGGAGKGSSGKGADPEKEELERRKKLQRSIEKEYSMRRTVNDAMRESVDLQTAYMSAAEKAAYEMQKEHERAVEGIQSRWLQFETEYIGMSDEERAQMVKNLEETGAAYEIMADGRLSMAKQVAADIAAAEKQYDDEIVAYHAQCKDILAEIDDAYRLNSMEKLQEALTGENVAIINAYNTKQNVMKRYYDNWLEAHKSTSDRVADIVLDSQDTFENFFRNILTGQKSFGDAFMDLLNGLLDDIVKSIAKAMASHVVNQLLGMIFPNFGFSSGGLARGGFDTYGAASSVLGINLGSFAGGGMIAGPGTSTSDSIPAMLSNGEYVINASAAKKIGLPVLNAINAGVVSHFARGGPAGAIGHSDVAGNREPGLVLNINNQSGMPIEGEQTKAEFDGEKWVLGIVINGIAKDKMGVGTMFKNMARGAT